MSQIYELLIVRFKWHSSRAAQHQRGSLRAGEDKLIPAVMTANRKANDHTPTLARQRSTCQRNTIDYSKVLVMKNRTLNFCKSSMDGNETD